MDTAWYIRAAYNEARKIKSAQDAFCQKVDAGLWEFIDGDFPEDLKWEMLVDVLRGKVKVENNVSQPLRSSQGKQITHHCYESVDIDQIVRVSVLSMHRLEMIIADKVVTLVVQRVPVSNRIYSSCIRGMACSRPTQKNVCKVPFSLGTV